MVRSPETPFFENERRHQLYDALAKLKPEYREALYLVYFEDMSYHTAAQVMNKNERQITNLIYRGKQSLKAILEKGGISICGQMNGQRSSIGGYAS